MLGVRVAVGRQSHPLDSQQVTEEAFLQARIGCGRGVGGVSEGEKSTFGCCRDDGLFVHGMLRRHPARVGLQIAGQCIVFSIIAGRAMVRRSCTLQDGGSAASPLNVLRPTVSFK